MAIRSAKSLKTTVDKQIDVPVKLHLQKEVLGLDHSWLLCTLDILL